MSEANNKSLKAIDKFMIDHCGDFGSNNYSIHKDVANCIATTVSSNKGHMVCEVYKYETKY